jgi:hypothetical protein
MTVDHVELDQIDEHQTFEILFQQFERNIETFDIGQNVILFGDAVMIEDVIDLADGVHVLACIHEFLHHGGIGRVAWIILRDECA